MNREAGKGSRQRPTDYELYSEGYDRIFRQKKDPLQKMVENAEELGLYDTQKTWNQIVEEYGGVAPEIPESVLEEIEENSVRIRRDIEERARLKKLQNMDDGIIG